MKLCMSDKNNKINQASAFRLIFTLFTLSSVPLACRAAVSLILSLFHVLPFFIWLPPEVISRVYGREVQRSETFMSLSSGIRVSCSGKSNKAPSTYRLLLVDPGIKPSFCSACKPGKAHISCIHHHPHIQLLSGLLQQQHYMWIRLSSRIYISYIYFCILYSYLDKTYARKSVTNEGTGKGFLVQGGPSTLPVSFPFAHLLEHDHT